MEGLSRKKLIQFDLEKELEETLPQTKEGQAQLSEFFLRPYEVYTVDQFIKDCPSFPDTNKDIIKREIISSIGATLAIEGTLLGEEEIEESFAKAELQKKLDNKEKESVNAKKAYNYIVKSVETCEGDFVHSEEQIKMIHHLLTDDVESISPNVPGQYRNTMAKFGEPRRVSLCKSETEIIEAMHRFVEWLNAKGTGILTTNPIVKALMAHYY
ncbi:MAG: Fic family protein, partial [Planctomycetota bacterium]